MTIRVSCPECQAVASVEEQSLGRRGRCKKCGHVFALARPGGEDASAISGDASAWKGSAAPPTRPSASPSNLPEQFGRYRIMKQLGQGGMGAVYLALDTRLDRQVALKVPFFHPSDGPQAVQRFEREARAAATLDHPNLCPVFDVGEVDGIHYLTMPYIEGKPFTEAIGRDRIVSEAQAAAVTRKLALALQEAHARGVIHRDLKPANIMINRRRDLVIMDFGLARMAGGDDGALTRTGHVLGTALYMAPEQAAGDIAAIGPAADVYSLGVILFELLTGYRPFEGPWSLVIGLKNVKDPDPPSKHRPDLSPALDAICLKAIAQRPEDRYPTMAEFAEALGAFLAVANVPVPAAIPSGKATPAPKPESLAAQAFAGIVTEEVTSLREDQSPARPKPARAGGKPPRFLSRAGIIAAAGAAVVLILGVIIYISTDKGQIKIEVNDPNAIVKIEYKKKDKGFDRTPREGSDIAEGKPPVLATDTDGFKPLFNGKDLTGWVMPEDKDLFTVEDGMILGKTDDKLTKNEFLVTAKPYTDFVLKARVKLRTGNSGIQFRSKRADDGAVSGPQADIGKGYWGQFYEERGRGILESYPEAKAAALVHEGDWNDFVITAKGDYVRISLNGLVIAEQTDPKFDKSGVIALQVHKGAGTEVRFKDIEIKELPPEVTSSPPAREKVPGGLASDITNTLGIKLKLIPAVEFAMGSDDADPDAEDKEKVVGKKHPVRISKSFYLGTTEVTVGQFRQFVEKANYKTEAEKDGKGGAGWNEAKGTFEVDPKSTWRSPGISQTDDHPVVMVSWNDARAFCEWLSDQEGQTYRLPTEAEWEYACRAGQTTRYCSGDDTESLATVGNVADGTARERYPNWTAAIGARDGHVLTAPVGRFRPNAFGLFDMHGNVWEWCADWYDPEYYKKSPPADPLNSTPAPNRVMRGGGFEHDPRWCRSAYRTSKPPAARVCSLGFRVARDAEKGPLVGDEVRDGWVSLFNGKDLSGWKTAQPGHWRVENGLLTGSGPSASDLHTKRDDYKDFHLHVEARINDGGNSGVFFRKPSANSLLGYEAQIDITHRDPNRTGSLYRAPGGCLVPVLTTGTLPEDDFAMDIIVEGSHIQILVNGWKTADFIDQDRMYSRGYIALQMHDNMTVVRFRKIEIKEVRH